MEKDARIKITGVTKTYGNESQPVHALNGVSMEIRAGEFMAVKGPSGCGKTTLLLTVGGLLGPSRGSVHVLGKNIYGLSQDERALFRAAHVGFVFQQFYLVPYLTVLENILCPSVAWPSDEAKEFARDLVNRFSLGERIHHVPAKLSTGERQRTAMARALLNKPDVLLADEPTGNLDEENGAVIIHTLRDFCNRGGTVLLVTHDPLAAQNADQVISMKEGKFA